MINRCRKLTNEQIEEMRDLFKKGHSQNSLSKRYNVTRKIIRSYVKYESPGDYENYLARRRGHESSHAYRTQRAIDLGFDSVVDQRKQLLAERGLTLHENDRAILESKGLTQPEYRKELAKRHGCKTYSELCRRNAKRKKQREEIRNR